MPSRVLDLKSLNEIRLLETGSSVVGRYVAPSHCWGPPDPTRLVLKSTNLASLKDKIEPHQLTRVFQDAVRITRHLGIRFLWIDALCIIQDSKADWANESAKMYSIYQRATLTVASSSSPDGDTPFLRKRSADALVGARIPWHTRSDGLKGTLSLRLSPHDARSPLEHLEEPLESRAWCLQERALSPCKIFFDKDRFL